MFSGIQEILVLVIIILGILFLPRILNRGGDKPAGQVKPTILLTGRMRLAIAASVLWPALIAVYLQPWKQEPTPFLYLGIGPVAVVWLIYWVFTGFKEK